MQPDHSSGAGQRQFPKKHHGTRVKIGAPFPKFANKVRARETPSDPNNDGGDENFTGSLPSEQIHI
jgi:hypothetical protein